ncbi:hypothetical protein [Bradyrhizobium sp. Ai1a-2]|uniref:hypothetical protein n=1 Tax=Bradyrhizobium sp. Ai1a-2 TaxID=196490 RepID=UPI001267D191|nr:hypothetical protein [Bradyrhizobium sp. Ai1a-2]
MLRLGESMHKVSEAWQRDVDALAAANGQVEALMRELNAAVDRASGLQGDLHSERERNEDLVRRNADLEAQMRALVQSSLSARDTLASLVNLASEGARVAPAAKAPPVRADGTTAPRPEQRQFVSAQLAREQLDEAFASRPQQSAPPRASARPAPRTLEDVRREQEQDDGTGLPPGPPAFLRPNLAAALGYPGQASK